jgi:hypothetical protein
MQKKNYSIAVSDCNFPISNHQTFPLPHPLVMREKDHLQQKYFLDSSEILIGIKKMLKYMSQYLL